ncbi:hypothetical protein A3J13_01270 [Candidatus Daviesbacteria bacterium RIFCSPLOWO2_02_FULL_36_8]|uniref:Regulatory protein RecX n=1 Tax=Candidatus Daviesbacteria bacterium RIFCSPLOWO2_02_FULL_36_8 TaxID=1797793 RepID=A0A1F5MGV8_9BACT|nr:MAG: hypothetical protein A3J13_01270 [Candidatus Daviesbacteria bacterium RIFCSPLOWO2_02_FULL_36_8]
MKITSVEPQKKNPKRFNIFLDGVFVFGADEDLVVDYRLIIGKEITPSDLEKLLKGSEIGKLMERMYRLFNIRQRSEKEVREYIRNLSFKRKLKDREEISEFATNSLIEKLQKKGMLNDLEFARSWMEARGKKFGINRIKQELYKKGINREIIEEVMNSEFRVQNSETVAENQLERKLERWKNLKPMEFRKKAFDFLLRRGFEYEIVKNIVEKIMEKG